MRRVLEESAGEVATDPVVGVIVAGRKRARTSAPYDLGLRGRRIEVKSAQLTYDKSHRLWKALWQNINEAYLVSRDTTRGVEWQDYGVGGSGGAAERLVNECARFPDNLEPKYPTLLNA